MLLWQRKRGMLLIVAEKKRYHIPGLLVGHLKKPHIDILAISSNRDIPQASLMRYTVLHLMVRTTDGKNELWPMLPSGSGLWTALPHNYVLFGWHSTKNIIRHLKIGIWSISYITWSSGNTGPFTLHSTNCMRFRIGCSLRRERGFRSPQPHLACFTYFALSALPDSHWVGNPWTMVLRSQIRAL